MQGLFEVIRSGEEGNVQDLLTLIRAEAPMAEIAAKVEDDLESSRAGQKRKWSVSDSGSSAKGTALTSQHFLDPNSPMVETSPYPVLDNPNLAMLNRDSWHPFLQLCPAQAQDLDTDQRQDTGTQTTLLPQFNRVMILSLSFHGRISAVPKLRWLLT